MNLSFARLETLSIAAQFGLVSRARLLIGNHGAGLTWAAMLPSAAHGEPRCAVLELYANASADGLPVDISHFAAANGQRRALPRACAADLAGLPRQAHTRGRAHRRRRAVACRRRLRAGPAPRRPRTGLKDTTEGTLRPPASDMVSTRYTFRQPANSSRPCSKVLAKVVY